jgi:uncharacterized C2H2 Zn-finger protein
MCKMSFSKESQLSEHYKKTHGKALNYICPKCDRIFSSYTAKQRHTSKNECNRVENHANFETNYDYQMSEIDCEISNAITSELVEDFEQEAQSNYFKLLFFYIFL